MNSIKFKLIPILLALVFIVMLVSGTLMLTYLHSEEVARAQDNLRAAAAMINSEILQQGDPQLMSDLGLGFLDAGDIKGYILNDMGVVQWASDQSEEISHFFSSAVLSAITGQAQFANVSEPDFSGQFRGWITYAMPVSRIIDGIEATYVIYTRTLSQPIDERLTEIALIFAFTVFVALGLACVLGFIFAGTLTRPIVMLAKIANKMAAGDLDQTIQVSSRDEIGQLTDNFNHMARELGKSITIMADEKNKMETILNNMSEGILAYDVGGRLIHCNEASALLLGIDDIGAVHFSDMLGKLGKDARSVSQLTDEDVSDTIVEIDDRYIHTSYRAYTTFAGQIGGIVIVLADITKQQMLDDLRKEFVANVSHEIRTPLTTIKGYSETLLDGALDDREVATEFLSIINSEADRMTLLAKDLLELSSFDNKQMKLNFEDVNLYDIIARCIRQTAVAADQKHQTISFDECGGDFTMRADPDRINQVLTNILSNAVKYSPEGSLITLTTRRVPGLFEIEISDQGMGIPKEDLPRIFERFYRVDKGRSRALGGTGLGLSIAKEIVEAHGGKISVTSAVGEGTAMKVSFPSLNQPEKEQSL
ncbi:MAG: cell wall metabolism sensor histidine kinase WalK [Defluviitaleaceae bacterium]|nr:cell wall metabolism sensor histidine kinase WalK [Defluviitaleaceae bacterium]